MTYLSLSMFRRWTLPSLPDSLRRIQGHRGRDDICPMILLQQDIRKHILSGFRPLQPLARGYAEPSPDVKVEFSAALVARQIPLPPPSVHSSEDDLADWNVIGSQPAQPVQDDRSDGSVSAALSSVPASKKDDARPSLARLQGDPDALLVEAAIRKAKRARWDLPGCSSHRLVWLRNHLSNVLRAAVAALPESDRAVR